MNVFWLLSMLLLWIIAMVHCQENGGGKSANQYGVRSTQIVLPKCDKNGDEKLPLLSEKIDIFVPITGEQNETLFREYRNMNENLDTTEKALVALKHGGEGHSFAVIIVQPSGKPATFKIRMYGECNVPIEEIPQLRWMLEPQNELKSVLSQ